MIILSLCFCIVIYKYINVYYELRWLSLSKDLFFEKCTRNYLILYYITFYIPTTDATLFNIYKCILYIYILCNFFTLTIRFCILTYPISFFRGPWRSFLGLLRFPRNLWIFAKILELPTHLKCEQGYFFSPIRINEIIFR